MDYKGLFLVLRFINTQKQASRKEIAEFLANVNVAESKTNKMIKMLLEKELIARVRRGIYESTNLGKIYKNKNEFDKFKACFESDNPQISPSPAIQKYIKNIAIAVVCELKDKLIKELSSKHTNLIKAAATKLIKKHKILGKIYVFRHAIIAIFVVRMVFGLFKMIKERQRLSATSRLS